MPQMSGLEVLQAIRKEFSEIELPVIIITAHPDVKELIRCLEAGANDCISRPFKLSISLSRASVSPSFFSINLTNPSHSSLVFW